MAAAPGGQRVLVLINFVSFGLLCLPSSLMWFWGNLVIYLDSYWYAHQMDFSYQAPLVISMFTTFWAGNLLLAGFLIKKVDSRIILLIGVLLYDSGIYLSRLSVEHSTLATVLTLGVLPGSGLAFIDTEILTRVPKLVKTKIGTSFAIVHSAFNLGAILIDVIVTWYANPNNEEVDTTVGRMKVLSEKSVIDCVPSIFTVIGVVASSLHLIGLCLTFIFRADHETKVDPFIDNPTKIECQGSTESLSLLKQGEHLKTFPNGEEYVPDVSDKIKCNSGFNFKIEGKNEETSLISRSQTKEIKLYDHISGNEETNRTSKERDKVLKSSDVKENLVESAPEIDLAPREVLKTRSFYVVWFSFFACDASFLVMTNFYKVFGELWIADDHFLTDVAVFSLISIIVGRLVWGVISDKLTVKDTQIITTSMMSVFCLFYVFTPQISRWLFAVWTCIMFSINAVFFVNVKIVAFKSFGKTYFGFNYGLILSSCIILNSTMPLLLASILHHFGWFGLYGGAAIINTIALVASFFLLSNHS